MKSRKIPNSIEGIRTAVRKMKERGLTVTASVLICDFNHTSLDALFAKCEELGFDFISANYPVFSPSPTYTLGGDAIKLTRENLIVAMRELLRLKKKYDIVNTGKSIENIITYLEGKTPPFPCLGGYRTFFLDWTFDLYPCMCFEKPLGNVFSLTRKDIRKRTCNLCNMSWYRDFSIFLQGFRSIPPLVQEIARVIRFK